VTIIKRLQQYPFVQAKYHSSRASAQVEVVVLHYTAGRSNALGLANFFARGSRKASAHFGVGRPGEVVQMVDLNDAAWHAGKSSFMGKSPVGNMSVGIEICNVGWAYMDKIAAENKFSGEHRNPACRAELWEKFTREQVASVQKLLVELKEAIPTIKYVTGHEDIRNTITVPSLRGSKTDPGPAFPWQTLATDSIGLERWAMDFDTKKWIYVPEGVIAT